MLRVRDVSTPLDMTRSPVVACYCATFLKPEMLHIYRQITALKRVSPVVIARKRENAARFPFDKIDVVAKPALHFLRRFWFRQVRDKPWQISPGELRALTNVLERRNAQLLHIYFGQIAVHLLPLIRAWEKPSIVSFHGAETEWRFVQAGRLIEKKGLPVTLRAFASFLKRYPNATLTIAGEGPLLGQLQDSARELKIDNGVSFTGFISQEQLRELYYASHIFLHPSETGPDGNQEGIPNSMLEAMASGLPVFATQHGGIPEAIENGLSGLLVPEHNHDELGRALLDAVQDPGFLSRIARAGADVVRKNFDLGAQARRLDDIYLRLIGRGD